MLVLGMICFTLEAHYEEEKKREIIIVSEMKQRERENFLWCDVACVERMMSKNGFLLWHAGIFQVCDMLCGTGNSLWKIRIDELIRVQQQ